jgi:hypothetical protein
VVNRLDVAHDATPEPQLDDFDYGPIYEGPLFWN